MEDIKNKVYLVWYDNGQAYEAHHIYLYKVYSREEDAQAHVDRENEKNKYFAPSMTKAEYYAQNPDDITCLYEQFVEQEWDYWTFENCGKYYYTEQEVHESLQ